MVKVNIPTMKLNSGYDIPVLGLGTWLGVDDKGDILLEDFPKMVEALEHAIDLGYRHIDTAHLYTIEPEIGEVVEKKIKEGVVKREDLFITTKVWNHMHAKDDVIKSVRQSLKRLKMDYVDMVLVHWPMAVDEDGNDAKIDYLETWGAMETVVELGLARSIGVSNFNLQQMKRLLQHCKVRPAVNQVELNLNLGQSELVSYCQGQGVLMTAFAPFGSMIPSRAAPDAPQPRIDNPTMVNMGKKYGKTTTQLALRYLYQRGIITIPKSVTKSRLLENASIFDFELSPEDMATLAKFDVGYRSVKNSFWQDHPQFPFDRVPGPTPKIPGALLKWKNGRNQNID